MPCAQRVIFELIWRDFFKFFSMKHGDRIFFETGTSGRTCRFVVSAMWRVMTRKCRDYEQVLGLYSGLPTCAFVIMDTSLLGTALHAHMCKYTSATCIDRPALELEPGP
jgi:hypothetical protein